MREKTITPLEGKKKNSMIWIKINRMKHGYVVRWIGRQIDK